MTDRVNSKRRWGIRPSAPTTVSSVVICPRCRRGEMRKGVCIVCPPPSHEKDTTLASRNTSEGGDEAA